MNWFENLFYIINNSHIETPEVFGLFHIVCLLIIAAVTIFMCTCLKNISDKTLRIIFFFTWIVLCLVETTKIIMMGFNYNEETQVVSFGFSWYLFPFQFCSSILYTLPLIVFCKNGKFRDIIMQFTAFFVLFGGLLGVLIPPFSQYLFLDIQTILHHGVQVIIGFFLLVYNKDKINFKNWLKSLLIFGCFLIVAIILNEVVYYTVPDAGYFDMFYISRHYCNSMPVLSTLYEALPWILYLLVYIVGFSFASFLIFILFKAFSKKNNFVKTK